MTDETFLVDKSLPTPAYLQIKERITAAIRQGTLAAGSTLPPERELAETMGVSRMTVRRAFEELASDHFIEQRQGSGTYVLDRRLEQRLDKVQGFTEEARMLGFAPGSVLLEARAVQADEGTATALQLEPGTLVLKISRLRTADSEPLAIQDAHLVPELMELAIDQLKASGSLYSTIRAQFGIVMSGARQSVGARLPTEREREVLAVPDGTPVLDLERTTLDGGRRPFEYVRSAYRSDKYRLVFELSD